MKVLNVSPNGNQHRKPIAQLNRSLDKTVLNVAHKSRSNLFSWRGQFTPQLVESLIATYAAEGANILDPFAGSGTVLSEAGRLGHGACGFEINPAAVLLAKTYELMNVRLKDRSSILHSAENILAEYIPDLLPLFNGHQKPNLTKERYIEAVNAAGTSEVKLLLATFGIVIDFACDKTKTASMWTTWPRFRSLVENLPESDQKISVDLGDAKRLPCRANSIDFVLTSPPYINVFNYHQYYRTSVETLGWMPLKVARSEIGSNRKFRQNRFLTVIQYCLDIAAVLYELQRVCHEQARIIFVVGRESNVRKTAFFNSKIISRLATDALGFKQEFQQERVFSNKFGKAIYEDILHLSLPNGEVTFEQVACITRGIARDTLIEARDRAPQESMVDLENAIERVDDIEMSPILHCKTVGPEQLLQSYSNIRV